MTYGELMKYAKEKFQLPGMKIEDYRPANSMYMDDLFVTGQTKKGETVFNIPNGIRFYLENGDSIIYVKKVEEGKCTSKEPCPFVRDNPVVYEEQCKNCPKWVKDGDK